MHSTGNAGSGSKLEPVAGVLETYSGGGMLMKCLPKMPLLVLLVACYAPCIATSPLPCVDSSFVPVDTLLMSTPLSARSADALPDPDGGTDGTMDWVVIRGIRPNGVVELVVDVTEISFHGDCSTVDSTSAASLLELAAIESVLQLAGMGLIDCPSVTRVYQQACVQRTGSGISTTFTPCDLECCWRDVAVSCTAAGMWVTVNVSFCAVGCELSSRCERTCSATEVEPLEKHLIH